MNENSNLNNEDLRKVQQFELVYSGPSFESGIKIEKFIENLKSIKELVYTIADINLENKKGYNGSKDIQEIKILPKKGSIVEEITILFSNPEVRSAIIGLILSSFFYLLSKRDMKKSEEKNNEQLNQIEELILRNQMKNVQRIYEPLEKEKDSLKIIENNVVKLEINFPEKDKITQAIREVEQEIKTEEVLEEHEGYISAFDLDKKSIRFHAQGMNQSYPLDSALPMPAMLSLLGRVIKAKMRVKKYKEKIRRFHLLEYTIIQRDIRDYLK